MGIIYDVRSNEKPRWKEIFPRAIVKVFGEEHQSNIDYSVSINGIHPSGIRIIQGKHIAWRKVQNPFKSFIEFPLTLLEDYADRACQIGAAYPRSHGLDHHTTSLQEIGPAYNYRWIPRLLVKIFIGIPVGIVRRITSPINNIYRPLVQFAQKEPFLFAGIVLTTGLLIGGLVLASVLWGGAIPFLGAFIPLQKLMHGIGMTSVAVGSQLSLWTGLSATTAVVTAKTAFVIASFIGGMSFAHKIAHKFVNSLYDLVAFGHPTRLQRDAAGQLVADIPDDEKNSYQPSSGKHNAISRLFFNTPKSEPVKEAEQLDNCYGWRSYFGGYSLLSGVPSPFSVKHKGYIPADASKQPLLGTQNPDEELPLGGTQPDSRGTSGPIYPPSYP